MAEAVAVCCSVLDTALDVALPPVALVPPFPEQAVSTAVNNAVAISNAVFLILCLLLSLHSHLLLWSRLTVLSMISLNEIVTLE